MFKPSPILQAYTLLAKEAPESPSAATAAEALRNEAAKECLEAYVSGALPVGSADPDDRQEVVFEINDQQTVKFFLASLERGGFEPKTLNLTDRHVPESLPELPVPPPPPVPTMAETIERIGRPDHVYPSPQPDFERPPVKLPRLAFDKSTGAAVPAEDLAKKPDSYSNDSESQKPELTPEPETPVLEGGTQAEAPSGKPYESLPVLINKVSFQKTVKSICLRNNWTQDQFAKKLGFPGVGNLAYLMRGKNSVESKWGTYLAGELGQHILA